MYMDKGFEMANDQIAKATAGGKKVSSMIIAFTDGTLEPAVFANTKVEARKARHMGATVYAVGVKDFLQSQLEGFADTKEHAFGVLGGFKALQSITDKLGEKSCIELKSLDPVVACVGGEYRVVVRGSGFQNTRDKSSVICRFKFTDNSILGPRTEAAGGSEGMGSQPGPCTLPGPLTPAGKVAHPELR
ncbi:anthrax toxin receptor 1-like [Dasypus novemcinctus]|uniref:anthrax toxin receptor 1-like n=1 Tax=Dasypus novemcinctus TaxID=9361 RepID=UPI00265F3B6A|nr:anthrax toxin receptor 1-like [Dasypus novemcinctus]